MFWYPGIVLWQLGQKDRAGLATEQANERRHQEIIERRSLGDLLAEFLRALAQLVVSQPGKLLLEGVDGVDAGQKAADAAVIGRAKKLSRYSAEHAVILSGRNSGRRPAVKVSAPCNPVPRSASGSGLVGLVS